MYSVTYSGMAMMNMKDRHITEAEVEYTLQNPESEARKGSTVDVKSTMSNGRRIIVRVEQDSNPRKVVAVMSPSP